MPELVSKNTGIPKPGSIESTVEVIPSLSQASYGKGKCRAFQLEPWRLGPWTEQLWIGLDWRATYREVNFSAVRAVPPLSGQRHLLVETVGFSIFHSRQKVKICLQRGRCKNRPRKTKDLVVENGSK